MTLQKKYKLEEKYIFSVSNFSVKINANDTLIREYYGYHFLCIHDENYIYMYKIVLVVVILQNMKTSERIVFF